MDETRLVYILECQRSFPFVHLLRHNNLWMTTARLFIPQISLNACLHHLGNHRSILTYMS